MTESTTVFEQIGLSNLQHTRMNYGIPLSLTGFRQYKWEIIDRSVSNYAINSMFMEYCKPMGVICPAVDNYPPVGNGEISPSRCPKGYYGYSYRVCNEGQFSEIQLDRCYLQIPSNIHYSSSHYLFVVGNTMSTGIPTVTGIVTSWYIGEGLQLPDGLTINSLTGEILGNLPK